MLYGVNSRKIKIQRKKKQILAIKKYTDILFLINYITDLRCRRTPYFYEVLYRWFFKCFKKSENLTIIKYFCMVKK